jgi:tyrosine-specific transport protein
MSHPDVFSPNFAAIKYCATELTTKMLNRKWLPSGILVLSFVPNVFKNISCNALLISKIESVKTCQLRRFQDGRLVGRLEMRNTMESIKDRHEDASLSADVGKGDNKLTLESWMGEVDRTRYAYPELLSSSGDVTRVFSSLTYKTSETTGKISAIHTTGSTLGAAALVSGTTIGAGILALPTATISSGFLPSTVAMTIAWTLMTASGLLIAELSINRLGETGRPGIGLLDLYESKLGKTWGYIGSAAYFFLHYTMMVAYIAQGGKNLEDAFGYLHINGQFVFAGGCASLLYFAAQNVVEKVNNILVFGVFASFLAILKIGVSATDVSSLLDLNNQHPEEVVASFPILCLALVYQNIVPTVVTQLEGDRSKTTKAIVLGTTLPFVMFVAWNAVILGNVANIGAADITDPIAVLSHSEGSNGNFLGNLIEAFSTLAVVTSLIGFVYGLMDALTDVFGLPKEGAEFNLVKPFLFSAIFGPPLALSTCNPEIFYQALDYGGAFGVSTLFLLLPPIMVWKSRYGDAKTPMLIEPLVPLGKLSLTVILAAATVLITQQLYDKLGLDLTQ